MRYDSGRRGIRIAKRFGVTLMLLLVIAYAISAFCAIGIKVRSRVYLYSVGGAMGLQLDDPGVAPFVREGPSVDFGRFLRYSNNWGFHLPARDRWTTNSTLYWVPMWLLFVTVAIPTAVLFRCDRAPLPGSCKTCGYDLRASPERCPECGTAVGGAGRGGEESTADERG